MERARSSEEEEGAEERSSMSRLNELQFQIALGGHTFCTYAVFFFVEMMTRHAEAAPLTQITRASV